MSFKPIAIVLIFLFFLPDLQGQGKFKVGIISFKSDEKVLTTFKPIIENIANELGQKAEVKLLSPDDLGYYLDRGDFDLGIFTVFPYLKEKQDFPALQVFATHQINGKDFFHGAILSNKDVGIEEITDLRKNKVLFVKPSSTSGYKYPKGILAEYGLNPEQDIIYEFSGDHKESILALKNLDCEAIAIDETRFAKLDSISKGDFKELIRYKVPYHAYVLSPKMKTEKQERLKEIFKTAHKRPEWKEQWNNPLGIERFILKDDGFYNSLRRYLRIVREKPTVAIRIDATEKAQLELNKLGDISDIIEKRVKRRISDSGRFSSNNFNSANYNLDIHLAQASGKFGYQIMLNDKQITDGDLDIDSLGKKLPMIATEALLHETPIKTNLLSNGEKWFVTYGLKDGLNKEDYVFEYTNARDEKVQLKGLDILSMNEVNIEFEKRSDFVAGMPLTIRYDHQVHEEEVIQSQGTYNIFSKKFWARGNWTKLLGLIGPIVALSLAFFGGFFKKRKLKNFKSILYDTNNLLKQYVHGQVEIETQVIQQHENIRVALEKGVINENQYMILRHRLDELEVLVTVKKDGERRLTDEETAEINEIVKDGKVTEREFTKIMRILRKR